MVKSLMRILALAMLLAVPVRATAVEDTMTGTFRDDVRTLQLTVNGAPGGIPVLRMDTQDWLTIEFDHLAEDREWLRYSLTHCNANWQPSGLVDTEFLDGFNEATIEDYDYSRGTTVHYVHYRIDLPNEQMMPLLSGNYLLRVYPEDNPDDTWLQCRFMVSENSALVAAEVTSRTDVDYNSRHQQLQIMVDSERATVDDPFNDLVVMIQQNGRLDNEVALRQPLRVSGAKSFYEHLPALVFEAGNEYRRFETVSTTYPGMSVGEIVYAQPYYHFTLYADRPRSSQPYLYDQTQHGAFVVREYNSMASETEADYVVVHFTLDTPPEPGTMIFIDGDLTNRRFDQNSAMMWNPETGRYERSMLLKQGAYNYQYLTVPRGAKRGYTANVEGDRYQTVNRYDIKVYHRRRGERYDRLIGTGTIYSGR